MEMSQEKKREREREREREKAPQPTGWDFFSALPSSQTISMEIVMSFCAFGQTSDWTVLPLTH